MSGKNNSTVTLRRLEKADAEKLAELANNRKIFDQVRDFFPHPYTVKNAHEFIEMCLQEDPQVNFAVEYEGGLAGVAGLVPLRDIYRHSAEIGYWIGEPFWNKGVATQAVQWLINYAFNELKLMRLHTGVFDFNKASQRVLEKCGFQFEGIHKKAVVKNGQTIDEYRYGLINEADLGKW